MKVLANNVETTLSADITDVATSITVVDATAPNANFPNPSGGVGVATIMDTKVAPTKIEVITYTGLTINGNGTRTLTGVARGQEATSAQAFSAGAYIAQFVTKQVLQDLQDDINTRAASSHTHAAADIVSGTFANARISQASVTQHQAALAITESQISDLQAYLTGITGESIDNLSDVAISAPVDGEVLQRSTGQWINRTLAEAGIAAASHTHSAAAIVSGTFADARIAGSNVTQHQALLTITESQISDLGAYLENITGEPLGDLSDVTITTIAAGELLKWSGSAWINNTLAEAGIAAVGHTHAAADVTTGTFADARIAQSNVTQHQAALAITESQVTDLGAYLLNITGEPLGDLSDVTLTGITSGEILKWDGVGWINNTLAEAGIAAAGHTHAAADVTSGTFADARIAQSSVTQHQAALSITESQISDLGAYLTGITAESIGSLSDVTVAAPASGHVLSWNGSAWVNGAPVGGGATELSELSDVSTTSEGNLGSLLWAGSNYVFGQPAVLVAASHHAGPTALTGTLAAAPLSLVGPTARSTTTVSTNRFRVQDTNYANAWYSMTGGMEIQETGGSTAEVEISYEQSFNGTSWVNYDVATVTLVANEKKLVPVFSRPYQLSDADAYFRVACREVSGSAQLGRTNIALMKMADDNDAA